MIAKVLLSPVSPGLALDILTGRVDTAARHPASTVGAAGGSRLASPLCPTCGSFLDAPRPHPASGRTARKCQVCDDWHASEPPVGSRIAV